MQTAVFEPTILAGDQQQNYATHRADTGTGISDNSSHKFHAVLLLYF